jgi:hypothetical protein
LIELGLLALDHPDERLDAGTVPSRRHPRDDRQDERNPDHNEGEESEDLHGSSKRATG